MLRYEGENRTTQQNQALAGFLSLVAGLVNSAGFVLVGSFSSHVTGNVGRLANDIASAKTAAALFAMSMVFAFFGGALFTSMIIEINAHRSRPHVYATLMFCEAGLLAGFLMVSRIVGSDTAHLRDVQALVLCAAMGLQNSLVTRLWGAVVRTTHLTGVVTDLGIESARWLRYGRTRLRLGLLERRPPTSIPTPNYPKTMLLLTVLVSFVGGSIVGSLLAVYWGGFAFLLPIGLLVGGGYLGLRSPRAVVNDLKRE